MRAGWLSAVIVAAAAGSPPAALAQAPAASPSAAGELPGAEQPALQEVTVTGSRLTVLPGMSTPTPVTSLSADQLLAVQPQSVISGLAQLPSLSTSTTPQSIGGRTTLGQGSFLNLRNLGSVETLILLDGLRVLPANTQNYVDVSLIPQALISNVDVVTGGASAAYGSDAVAGVVNFVLNTHFTGFKVDVGAGRSNFGDGGKSKLSVAWGSSFLDGRLHVIASFDWLHSQAAYYDNRPWASGHCAAINVPGVTTATQSPTNPLTRFECNVAQPYASYGGAITSGPLTTPTQGISFGPGGIPQPFTYGSMHTNNYQVGGTGDPVLVADTFNFITPLDTKMAFGHIEYDISDKVHAFAQVATSRSVANYPETPSNFDQTRPFTIYSDNPFIPASLQTRMTQLGVSSFQLGIVPLSWGYIDADDSEEAYDAVAGLKGEFGGDWSWEFHYEHGRSQWEMTQPGNPNLQHVFAAVDAVTAPNGTIVCRAALLDPAKYGNCSPLNVLGPGAASPQALAYIFDSPNVMTDINVMTQDDVTASLNGVPFSSWAGPVSFAAGVEWRRLAGVQESDPLSSAYPLDFSNIRGVSQAVLNQNGGWLTTNPHPYGGAYHVTEGFLEFLVPLARNLPLMEELDLNAAGRVTDYSQSGRVETWKLGLTWRPVNDLLLRVTGSRDIRAPNIYNLFTGVSTGTQAVTDPFNGGGTYQIKFSALGNTQLVPETATTLTTGLTYQPSWLRGFAASVDYYDIEIKDLISSYSAQQELTYCYAGYTELCQYIQRLSDGTLYLIYQPQLNLNKAQTRGLDFQVGYGVNLSGGKLNTRLIGTKLISRSTTNVTPTGSIVTDYAGDLSSGDPEWLLNLIASYDRGPIGFDLSGRFVSSGQYNPTLPVGQLSPEDQSIPSNFTLNAGVRYTLKSLPGDPQLYFTIQNVLNKAPPLLPSTALFGGQTNAQLYDTMGRYFFGGIRLAF